MNKRKADVLIIGSGIAGLLAAKLLSKQKNVIVITKGKIENSNSIMAQGGIAAAIDKNDHWKNHFTDTIVAGSYHNTEEATKQLVKYAPNIIQQLIDLGVPFDRNEANKLDLGQEGGHHRRRIVHAGGDATGKEITVRLIEQVKKQVPIYQEEIAVDLLIDDGQCLGVITKNDQGETYINQAQHTIIASGGIGELYSITSNDVTVTGDSIAMAYRAGAELVDLEFIQFHPTMLVNRHKSVGLVSEAVRGEGARLVNQKGEYIMAGVHPLKDLAPRDIVARTIFRALQKGDMIYLDISMIENFRKRFPTITNICDKNGIDLENGLLPISPGAHFIMGGIKTDLKGESSIKGLYAIGEAAYTGVHGANRLASNSLLEGAVFANKLAAYILQQPKKDTALAAYNMVKQKQAVVLPDKNEIQNIMIKKVGIIRDEKGLVFAKQWFEQYLSNLSTNNLYDLTIEQIIIINMITTGWLITTSALKRTESRGGHFRRDYPGSNDKKWLKQHIIRRREGHEPYQIENAAAAVIH